MKELIDRIHTLASEITAGANPEWRARQIVIDAAKVRRWIENIARMYQDGECKMHEGEHDETDECELFDMTNDDAVETLNNIIAMARQKQEV